MAEYSARMPIASPPSGRPGRVASFQAYMSRCSQLVSGARKRRMNKPATTAPAKGFAETLLRSAIGLSSQLS